MFRRWLPASCLFLLLAVRATGGEPDFAFFEAKIRPVLVERCYECHSEKKQKGGLRLDSKAALLKGGDSGKVVIPGKAGESLLIKALRYDEPKMPPTGKLADAVVADFVKWVDMGAPDSRDGSAVIAKQIDWTESRKFWSFRPITKPTPPEIRNPKSEIRNPIDAFILARLEKDGLSVAAPANKHDLIRRATFDLTGLPPTPEEIDDFLKDESPTAFAKVVERLLKSPHYGERWGRHWLDVARYAEDQAHTFAVTPYTSAWRYRDWVIGAFNDDLPFDRFVKLQFAADLLEMPEPERVRHLPALGFFGLGAQYYKNSDAAKAAADELDDRVDTFARGLLGLTVSCARCHDHKFDPIPTQDYYSIAGVFANTKLSNLPLGSKEEVRKYDDHQRKMKELDDGVKLVLRTERGTAAGKLAADVPKYMLAAWQYQGKKQTDPKWTTVEQAKVSEVDEAVLRRWVKFLDGNPKMAALDGWKKLTRDAKEPAKAADVRTAAEDFQKKLQAIVTESCNKPQLDKPKADLFQAVFGDKGIYPLPDAELVKAMPVARRQDVEQKQDNLNKLRKTAPPALPVSHGLTESGTTDLKVYVRGNPAKMGDTAPRRFLRILAGDAPKPFAKGSGRLELAECVVSRDNPLTARVFVNRVWAWHFGRGLVGTPSNFGQMGERPTHPELLDYLAARFIESGWSIKALHREIMLSATYQRSCNHDANDESVDADNRLLWRANRQRLDVESWRDAMLAVSGKLDDTMGGPTFDLSNNQSRRTVYARVSRHNLDSLLRLFDFPEANLTAERRTETTVPQQQLFVLNSPFAIEMAKALAARVQKDATEDAGRLTQLFRLAYGREPSSEERELALAFLKSADSADDRTKIKLTRWERLAQVVLGGNEFLYVD